jgi:hypothetical protein
LLCLLILHSLSSFQLFAGDLTVGWIQRLPSIDYVWGSEAPDREGWPAEKETVTWRGQIRNWMEQSVKVSWAWRLDGVVVASGDLELSASTHSFVDFDWPWTFERHRLSLEIDTKHQVSEESESNNKLEIYTDAITMAFYIEQRAYDFFRETQHKLGIGSTCFENWAQRHVDFYNEEAALAAVYPETPDGVLDRFRLDRIEVVPDDALPLVPLPDYGTKGGEPNSSTHPNTDDRSVDMLWGLPAVVADIVDDSEPPHPDNRAYVSRVVLHEFGHARYLTDVYAWDVSTQGSGAVNIFEPPDAPEFSVAGSQYMPNVPGRTTQVFVSPEQGLMHDQMTFFDRYSAILLNHIAGNRAVRGNYNEPENIGEYMNDLPAGNTLVLRDPNGDLLTNATVQIFQAEGERNRWYWKGYNSTPDLTLATNASGEVDVGRNPFSADGEIVNTWKRSNVVAIIRVRPPGRDALYGFLESRVFNLAYWRGEIENATHEVTVGPRTCAQSVPEPVSPPYLGTTGTSFELSWDPVANASGYEVWLSENLEKPQLIGTTTATSLDYTASGTIYWWVTATFDGCPPLRSMTGKFKTTQRRRGVRR